MTHQKTKVPLIICAGSNEQGIRKLCGGAWMGFAVHHTFYAWLRDCSLPAIKGRRMAHVFGYFYKIILGVLMACGVVSFCVLVTAYLAPDFVALSTWISLITVRWIAIAGGFATMFFISKTVRDGRAATNVDVHVCDGTFDKSIGWESVSKFHGSAFRDMSHAWDARSMAVFETTLLFAEKKQYRVTPFLLLLKLCETREVKNFLIRFELVPADVIHILKKNYLQKASVQNNIDDEVWHILAQSYCGAAVAHDPKVSVVHVVSATILSVPAIVAFFEKLGVREEVLHHGISWMHFYHRIASEYRTLRARALAYNVSDVGADMTGIATPLLNSIARNVSREIVHGSIPYVVERVEESTQIMRAYESGRRGVLIVGESGSGKMSLIENISQRIVEGRVPHILRDKRLLLIPISQIISGTNVSAAYVRLIALLDEAAASGNVMLAFENIDGLCGIHAGGDGGQDLSAALVEMIERTGIRVIATSTTDAYRTKIAGTRVASMFQKVDCEEVDENSAIEIVESRVPYSETRHHVFFTYNAVAQCVALGKKFIQDAHLPESALTLLEETGVHVRNTRGKNSLVTGNDVGLIVAQKTNIPVNAVDDDERVKLTHLEERMHERVVGQDAALKALSDSLRRARTNMRSGKRPIASFLFLGPTGVGKTETAKTLAAVYFGGEERMLRFDMSEFQGASGVNRFIGESHMQGTGMFTEGVRTQPFSLVLFDEFEKADQGVLNLFLQIMDDGRITDSTGRLIDCTNIMIIATSNAGSSFIQDAVQRRESHTHITEQLITRELNAFFKPELLNRFDGIIVFEPLTFEQIEEISHAMVFEIGKRMYETHGIKLVVTDRAIAEIARSGYDPSFGARPLRRVIQTEVEDKVAAAILNETISRNQTLVIDGAGKVTAQY